MYVLKIRYKKYFVLLMTIELMAFYKLFCPKIGYLMSRRKNQQNILLSKGSLTFPISARHLWKIKYSSGINSSLVVDFA